MIIFNYIYIKPLLEWMHVLMAADDRESLLGDPTTVSFRDKIKRFPKFTSRMGPRHGWISVQLFLEVGCLHRPPHWSGQGVSQTG